MLKIAQLIGVLAVVGAFATGCVTAKPETVAGQPKDPGRTEEAMAEDAEQHGDMEQAREHRQRAAELRYDAYAGNCNAAAAYIDVIIRKRLSYCGNPRHREYDPRKQLL